MKFYAHTAEDANGKVLPAESGKWQPLRDHLKAVSTLARSFADVFGLGDDAEFAGLLHDLGKYSGRFQSRLRDRTISGINHWSAGASVAFENRFLEAAFAIEGHHTGMPALKEDNGDLQSLLGRIRKVMHPKESEEVNGFKETKDELFARFRAERFHLPSRSVANGAAADFATALRTRMILSSLVDADRLDTERHFNADQSQLRCVPNLLPQRALELLRCRIPHTDRDNPINVFRRQLLADCLATAERPPGLFSLTAPTGSGKTLASLAFALAHAQHHGHRRIIVVIPFTSIIEQTAQVYRNLFEDEFGPGYVLEHHSAVTPSPPRNDEKPQDSEDRIRRTQLAAENWDSPLIVTTSVQFFESLFAHKPSPCRKLHNIANAVVLFDEVQTLPLKRVPALLSAVNVLVKEYGVTAVFGTATQPAFNSAASAILGEWNPTEISSQPRAMAQGLLRTRISRRPVNQRPTWTQLAEELATFRQVLCVVNLRRHARDLFQALAEIQADALHLSASMCPAHRQEILKEIRRRLVAGEPCRLISTQLIEAGVDVDFPRVYRAMAPLDSIIQSAGRCNREGSLSGLGEVTVFCPEDNGKPKGIYEAATSVSEAFLNENEAADLHQPDTYAAYFARLYGTLGPQSRKDDAAFTASEQLNFPKAAQECRLVSDNSLPVVVPWGEGQSIIAQMRCEKHLSRDDWRMAQRFSVNFYEPEFYAAVGRGEIVQCGHNSDFCFWNGHYDDHIGATAPATSDFTL